ncbi:hypothetical protein PHMEG_00024762 [Phytophthora megakarya]|uniref:Uncharacterized protein n=1 Tax=Phytophthora megakarya TaxID=4795 RepID=A0A225VEZ0_9STRA|nr:hypothetical protein PHMEG_00024762 [Phytophthora megakarya]
MIPTGFSNTSRRPSSHDVPDADEHGLNVVSYPFALLEGTHSDSGASDTLGRGRRSSNASCERLNSLEGLVEGMAKQQMKFMEDQAKLQKQMQQREESAYAQPFEHPFSGSSAFPSFLKARDRKMRVGSLDASMLTALPAATATTPVTNVRPVAPVASPEQPQVQQQAGPAVEQFAPPTNFGVKIPKPRDLDWPAFIKFSGKEVYPGLDADFKPCELHFLQRLGAAQQISSGDWPEEFRILALNGKLDGTALHVMNRMLVPYITTITAAKGLQLMTPEK